MKDEEKGYFILQVAAQEEAEGSFATTIDVMEGFYTRLKATAQNCGFDVAMASAKELAITERPGAFFVLVTACEPLNLRELAAKFLGCIDHNLADFTVLLPFEDGAKLAPAALDATRWAEIDGFLDIQVEHGKKPKFKLLIGAQ